MVEIQKQQTNRQRKLAIPNWSDRQNNNNNNNNNNNTSRQRN